MDRTGHKLFATTGFAFYQYCGGSCGHSADHRNKPPACVAPHDGGEVVCKNEITRRNCFDGHM